MGCGIFIGKARKLIFHNKIQQSGINFTRFHVSSGSNQSTNKIIGVGIGKVTLFSIPFSHRNKASNPTHEHTKSKQRNDEWKRGEEKANLFENHFRSGGKENERQMADNVMQEIRVYDGYLVCLDLA